MLMLAIWEAAPIQNFIADFVGMFMTNYLVDLS